MKKSDYLIVENFCIGLFLVLISMMVVTFIEFSMNPTIFSANHTFSVKQVLLFAFIFFLPFGLSILKKNINNKVSFSISMFRYFDIRDRM